MDTWTIIILGAILGLSVVGISFIGSKVEKIERLLEKLINMNVEFINIAVKEAEQSEILAEKQPKKDNN